MRSNFGAELRLGNGPGADGTWMDYLHPTKNVFEMGRYRELGELAYVAERNREAMAYIREDYPRFAVLSLKRFIYYWGGLPKASNNVVAAYFSNALFLASSVLAFWGLGRALRKRQPGAWLFFWLVLSYPLVYYFVFPHPRYRHPIEPELGILIVYVISEVEGRGWSRRAPRSGNRRATIFHVLMNHSRYSQQDELESRSGWERQFERWFEARFNFSAILVVTAGCLIRLKAASGTFLNPDEALHYLLANQSSWRLAYEASLTNAHPPLLTFVLYFWRTLGDSEFVLRLPSVIAGTAFCWIVFKWLTRIFGPTAGFLGLMLVTFLPPMIGLAAEVRQYALLLFFLASAAYWLERALEENSSGMMLLSPIFLCLAMLTHYSAILFAAAMGFYSLLRVTTRRPAAKVCAAWVLGQAAVLALFAFLYVTHISKLKGDYASGTINGWLSQFLLSRRDMTIRCCS